jgi:hypothetical protein
MNMSKRYDVMAPRAKKDGTTFWVRIGTAFEGDRGIGIEFDALPVPDKEGRVSVRLFEPRQQGEARHQSRPDQAPAFDDDVPF